MDAERWARIKSVFNAAAERPADERAAFIRSECNGDEALASEVESLLAANDQAGSFIEALPTGEATVALEDLPIEPMIGQMVGPYRVINLIGRGGMGEVYLAQDSRLARKVALKLLPSHIAQDRQRLERFKREARAASALNHPNILTIHEIGDAEGSPFIATEFIEGVTLRERMADQQMKLGQALDVIIQVASALSAAHQAGIAHRDIKPENIMIRRDGYVKVLDFGLAKLVERSAAGPEASTLVKTEEGVIMGTARYMSPEQARGQAVDARTDIWSLGVVLYEMLSGRAPFEGATTGDVIVSILEREPPPLARYSPEVPAELEWIATKALRKDREERYQTTKELLTDLRSLKSRLEYQAELERTGDTGSRGGAGMKSTGGREAARPTWNAEYLLDVTKRHKRGAAVALATLIVVLAATAYVVSLMRQRSQSGAPRPPMAAARFTIVPPPGTFAVSPRERDLALSPDGRYLVYRSGPPGSSQGPLMLRAIDRLEAHQLAGVTFASWPFFSPDSRWIGFTEGSAIKKVSIAGGPPITICQNEAMPVNASWGDDGSIVYGMHDSATGLFRVSASGGEPEVLTTPNVGGGERDHSNPSHLPGGRGVLFTNVGSTMNTSQVAVLDSKTGQIKTLIQGGGFPEYIPPSEGSGRAGHLIYAASGALLAVRFDPDRLEVLGDPVTVVESVQMSLDAANYAVSQAGTLAYVPGEAAATRLLVWVDRKGHETPLKAPPRGYMIPRISPDGANVALEILDQENDIWIWDLARENLRRLTPGPGGGLFPAWTPDSRRIIFRSGRTGRANLYSQNADGSGAVEQLTASPNDQYSNSVTPDGRYIIGSEFSPKTAYDVVRFPMTAISGPRSDSGSSLAESRSQVEPLVQTPFLNSPLSFRLTGVIWPTSQTSRGSLRSTCDPIRVLTTAAGRSRPRAARRPPGPGPVASCSSSMDQGSSQRRPFRPRARSSAPSHR
jgi:serine/threonine-protein kinase